MTRIVFLISALLLFSYSQLSYAIGDYELVIKRSEKRLMIIKEGVTLRSFHVALGSGGGKGKQQAGDHKTPMGEYRIVNMRDSDRFHLFLQLDYPSVSDAVRALKQDLINIDQYRAILDAHIYKKIPPQNTPLGGAIGIHGIGLETKDKLEIHEIADWTQGCIALRNAEVDQLMNFIQVGTPVIITE